MPPKAVIIFCAPNDRCSLRDVRGEGHLFPAEDLLNALDARESKVQGKHEKGRVYERDTPPDKRRLTQTTEPSLPSPLCSCSYQSMKKRKRKKKRRRRMKKKRKKGKKRKKTTAWEG